MPLLVRHPDTPPGAIRLVEAELMRVPGGAIATFRAVGDISRMVIPAAAAATATDGLWKSTCFEMFVTREGAAYREYNFSPSSAFAAYAFDGHRAGMRPIPAPIEIQFIRDPNSMT